MKKIPQNWLLLTVVILLFLVLGLLFVPEPLKKYPPFVSDSPSPTGVKALYTYLQNNGTNVGTWNQGNGFPASDIGRQTMIMIEPYQPLGGPLEQHWINWMEQGNRIWLMVQDPREMFQLETTFEEKVEIKTVKKVFGNGDWKGQYEGVIDSKHRLIPQKGDQVLLRDEQGVLALIRSFGKGELMVTLTPEWVQNENILKEDHITLITPFLDKIANDVVWFNESIHGYKQQGAFAAAYPQWFLMILAQFLLIGIFFIWWKGKRFGPIEIPRAARVRFNDERIRAMAAWYERSGFYQEALLMQQNFLRNLLQEKWYIPENLDLSSMLSHVSSRLTSEQLTRWKKVWEEGDKVKDRKNISRREFLHLSQQFDRIRKEIES